MKSILTLISLIFLVSQVDAQKYNRKHFEQYPDCAEVIQHFYENNHDALKLPRGRYWFEKRQDGWYACLHDDYNRYGKASKEQMVWDAKAKKYLEEDNQALTVSNQQYLAGIIREYHLFEYKIWPVCGYRNAATDVIKLLSPVKKLTDNELEALARAYNKVSGYLIEYNTLKTSVYDSTLNKNTFSSEVLTEYVSMAKKSMANYKKLLEQNPAYSTIVGYIETKHAHEIMSFYLNLNMIQQGKLAEEFLDIAEYNDFFLASAKNYLRSCPPNAILVTWGDSDYYPLCYVQAKLGFRKDVTILNKSLMALARHINYTSNTLLPKENRVQISMNLDLYKGWLNDYLYVTKDRTEFDYSDFTQKMNENPAQYKYRNLGDRPIHKLPSSSMLLGKDDQLLLKIANSYIIKDEFFLFDLINTNWQKRPICFTSGVPIHRIAYLSNYLVQRGEVYELTKETANAENYQNQPFNVKISEALVLKEFEFEPYTLEQSSSTEYLSQNMHYSTLFSDLIEYHIEEGNPTIIKNILDKMYEKLPPAITVLKSSHLQIAQYYSELNPTHKRIKEYIEAYANQLQMGIDKWEESDKIARMHLTTNARDFKSLAKLLIESCRMHRLEKLRVKYKEQFAKYLPRN